MKKLRMLMIMLAISTTGICAEKTPILSVKSIKEVQAKVAEVLKTQKPEDILVALDVDMTLTQPDHPAVYYPAIKKHYTIIKDILNKLTDTQRDLAMTMLTIKLPQRLIEKDAPKVVRAMQDKGVKVIAFTATLAGVHTDSKNKTIFKRRDLLQVMGFNFSFAGRVVSYTDFPKYADGYPILYHGVLSANGEANVGKGRVLEAFLKQVAVNKDFSANYVPKVVIMVDDKIKNLEDVQTILSVSHPDIVFIGIEYQGAFNYAPKDLSKKDISEKDFTRFWQGLATQAKLLYPA